MFLPIGDSPNPVGFKPWVNYGLIAANVLVYLLVALPLTGVGVNPRDPAVLDYVRAIRDGLPPGASIAQVIAQLSAYDLYVFAHGYKPGAPEISDLFSSLFLHGGFFHLAGNMLFLWIYGDNVEHRLGRVGYLLAYLGSGVVATWTFSVFSSGSMTPLVGASGAISGVLGLYFYLFPRNMVKVFFAFFPFFVNTIWVRARWVLAAYVLLDNLLPFLSGASSSVAYGAHLGGFFAGLGLAYLVNDRAPPKGRTEGHSWDPLEWQKPPAPGRTSVDPQIEAIAKDLALGRLASAVERATPLAPEQLATLPAEDLYDLCRGLAESGRDRLASKALRRGLSSRKRTEDGQAILHLALGELRLAQGQPAAAFQHLMTAKELAPGSKIEQRARLALSAMGERGHVGGHW